MTNPLAQLAKAGQSVWYDQMERKLVTSGKLQKMIEEDDLRGLTSNPTIFEKAIGGSEDYDTQLRTLASQEKNRDDIYDDLVVEDIGNAADVFAPVFEKTNGGDGFVSLEVSPLLASDTAKTVSEARRLFGKLGRPNVMIKIPATPEGIPAIEQAIYLGININVTLIFSNEVYGKVMEAYIRGLERRAEQGLPVGDIASVASFFVSRIDAQADKQIEAKLKETGDKELEQLLGKVAIANAKVAYQQFREVFGSARFLKLRDLGAKVQRPLWASTGTKNPKYSDVLYIESLVGPDTVNTIPPATYEAFRDHGKIEPALEQGVDEAKHVLALFEAKGFSLDAITTKLTSEGVKSFNESFEQLMATIEARRDAATRGLPDRLTLHLGAHQAKVDEAIERADKEKFVERLWSRDASVWTKDEAGQKIIGNALGWLAAPEHYAKVATHLMELAHELRGRFTHVVVLGMGGSSLCSEVTRRVFGKQEGYPELLVLDSTVPEAVTLLEAQLDMERTLFIVASKSGTTTEPLMFQRYFFDRVKAVKGANAGQNFIAITDPGAALADDAARDRYLHTFLNSADVGGRYSALTYFGLVPAALAGYDLAEVVERALHAQHIARVPNIRKNPPALLGTVIGALGLAGRDKLTLITPAPLDKLGLWVEQLIAESTGKEGKGIVPIAGEPELPVEAYGDDRLFVSVRLRASDNTARLRDLAAAGHPVVDLVLEDALDLGEIFYVWEFATAIAGACLGINAFDQPNVQESKDNTKRILEEYRGSSKLTEGEFAKVGDDAAVAALLAKVKAGDYVALTEYFAETHGRDERIAEIREAIARELHVATTTGYAPRFLHSTGQLHKGGADNGVFLQLTADSPEVAIPDEPFGFAVLARAQAIGDFESLASRNRRRLRVHLGSDVEQGLQWLAGAVRGAVEKVKA